MYADQARKEFKKHTQRVGVIGPAESCRDQPSQFLKKHTTAADRYQKVTSSNREVYQVVKDVVGERKELWKYNKQPAVPVQVETFPASGPRPAQVYREKKNFGKVPTYLKSRKQELQDKKEKAELVQDVMPGSNGSEFQLMPDSERVELISQLQARKDTLMFQYQRLSLVCDTQPKIHRKTMLDRELDQIEVDLGKFSHTKIFIHKGV